MHWLILIPISQFNLGPAPCIEGNHSFEWEGITKDYTLHIAGTIDELYGHCGVERACIKGSDVYVTERCEKQLAHELSHLFKMHWVDRP